MTDYPANQIRRLSEYCGSSLMETKQALESSDWDAPLAAGILKFQDKAINIIPQGNQTRDQARHEWIMAHAREYAEIYRADIETYLSADETTQPDEFSPE